MGINKTEYQYIVKLLRCVLRGEKPDELPEGASFEGVYKKAAAHHVENAVFYGIEQLENKPEQQLYKHWRQDRDKGIARDMNQCHELEALKKVLEDNGIRYIVLKGSVMKGLYPSTDIRYMCDSDIVVDGGKTAQCKEIMESLGYEVEHYNQGNHDAYVKKPVMSVEIHRSIFSDTTFAGKNFFKLFEKPFEVSRKVSEYGYELEPTYFFLHLLTHTAKHYINSGVGLRAFMDIWLYIRKYADEIDYKAIEKALEGNNYKQLCLDFIKLSQMWFGDLAYDGSFDEMAEYIFKGGAFGTLNTMAENKVKQKGRAGYFFSYLFPSFKELSVGYPVIKKCPILYPAMLVWRIISKPFNKKSRAKIKASLKAIFKKK